MGGWEEYAIGKGMNKPVQLLYLPDAAHSPVRPTDQLAVKSQAVNWSGSG
jgi:dipeptidyl aminopeptidase/acylaminoacyl peptidase